MRVCPEAIWIWLKWKFAIYRFWHKCVVTTGSEIVCLLVKFGKHLLALSSSQFDPERPLKLASFGSLRLCVASLKILALPEVKMSYTALPTHWRAPWTTTNTISLESRRR